jgi:hypothetical protein
VLLLAIRALWVPVLRNVFLQFWHLMTPGGYLGGLLLPLPSGFPSGKNRIVHLFLFFDTNNPKFLAAFQLHVDQIHESLRAAVQRDEGGTAVRAGVQNFQPSGITCRPSCPFRYTTGPSRLSFNRLARYPSSASTLLLEAITVNASSRIALVYL